MSEENNKVPRKIELTRNKLILSNLSSKDKKSIRNGSFILGGLSVEAFYSMINSGYENAQALLNDQRYNIPSNSEYEELAYIYLNAYFSDINTNELDFPIAFTRARKQVGSGGFFRWKGNVYSTYYGEEWSSMSLSERREYIKLLEATAEYETLILVSTKVMKTADGLEYMALENEKELTQFDEHNTTEKQAPDSISTKSETGDRTEQQAGIEDPFEDIVYPVMDIGDLDKGSIPDAISKDPENNEYADVIIADLAPEAFSNTTLNDVENDIDLDIIIIDEEPESISDYQPSGLDAPVNIDEIIKIKDDSEVDRFKSDQEDRDSDHPDDFEDDNNMNDLL